MSRRFWRTCKNCGRSAPMGEMNLVYGPGKKTWWWVCRDGADCEAHRG